MPIVAVVTAIRHRRDGRPGSAASRCGRLTGAHGTLTLGSNGAYIYEVNENDAPCRRSMSAARSSPTASTTRSGSGRPDRHGGAHHHDQRCQRCAGRRGRHQREPGASPRPRRAAPLNGASRRQRGRQNVLGQRHRTWTTPSVATVTAYRTGTTEGAGDRRRLDGRGAHRRARHADAAVPTARYIYVVNENDGVVQGLNVGQSTTDIFNYTFKDPAGLTDTARAHHHHQWRERCAGRRGRHQCERRRKRRDREGRAISTARAARTRPATS